MLSVLSISRELLHFFFSFPFCIVFTHNTFVLSVVLCALLWISFINMHGIALIDLIFNCSCCRIIEDTILLALHSPEVYDDIARGTRHKFESNRPRAVLFEGPPGLL